MASIEHLQIIHVPAAEVYLALTSAKGLSEVWTRELSVLEHVGAVNEFHFGKEDLTRMKIVELVPNKRMGLALCEFRPRVDRNNCLL